jgi:hypothetical protein
MTTTNQTCIHKEIKSKLNLVQNFLSFHILSKNLKIIIYRTITLSVVLCGCETLSVTLKEECRLRVFENMAMRRIFGLMREEMAGGCRKLHNVELRNLYTSPNIITVTIS